MVGMRNIQEMVRARQLEILRAVEGAAEQQETELWQLRKSLLNALRVVNRLLEIDEMGAEAARAEADSTSESPAAPRSSAPGPVPVLTRRYEDLAFASAAKAAGEHIPTA